MNAFGDTTPRVIPLDLSEDQFQIYSKISRNYTHSFLFESLVGPQELAETSVMGFDPKQIVRGYYDHIEVVSGGRTQTIKTENPFLEIKKLLRKTGNRDYRYLGGAVGMVNYDATRLIEDIPDTCLSTQPVMEFGMYDDGILYDNIQKKPFYFYHGENRFNRFNITDDVFGRFDATEPVPNINQKEFAGMVDRAKEYIHAGDIFQVVLARKFQFDASGDDLALYRALRRLNPSPYMYHLKQGEKITVGASPEMLVRITGDLIETFPIAGTRKMTGDRQLDKQLGQELLSDNKELAEHTMLVDLGRNDIGRVCRSGSVRPESLMQVRQFSHVQHLVTHITGRLGPGHDMFDAFEAVFPAGTVSGAPKVRAMELIDELEGQARGPYAGAIGYFSYNGCCDFAIAIRSIFIDGNKGFIQSGAGIVSDSIAENEFKETQDKAGAMLQALREASA